MSIKQIQDHTIDQHVKALSDYHPGGPIFEGKADVNSTLYKLIKGLSGEFIRVEETLKSLQEDYIPDKTQNFIPDWQRALGIPDDCFSGEGTNEENRREILAKLASLGVQTEADFQNLAAIFGVTVNIIPGGASGAGATFPMTFPFSMLGTPEEARFTIIVEFVLANTFPFTFPFEFGSDIIATLECLYNKLKPANCQVIFTAI